MIYGENIISNRCGSLSSMCLCFTVRCSTSTSSGIHLTFELNLPNDFKGCAHEELVQKEHIYR